MNTQLPGALTYSCEDPEDPTYAESNARIVLYVRPDTQRFLELNAKYFYDIDSDDGLEITFRAEYNSLRVCRSRASPEEIATGKSRWEDSKYEVLKKT